MTLPAVHASLTHLITGMETQWASIFDKIDGVASSQSDGGSDVFASKLGELRSAVESAKATVAAIHDTARTAVGLPYEPKVEIPAEAATIISENQSAEDTAVTRRSRATRTSVGEGE